MDCRATEVAAQTSGRIDEGGSFEMDIKETGCRVGEANWVNGERNASGGGEL